MLSAIAMTRTFLAVHELGEGGPFRRTRNAQWTAKRSQAASRRIAGTVLRTPLFRSTFPRRPPDLSQARKPAAYQLV